MVRTCGPKRVGSGCLRDTRNRNRTYCDCNDGNLCNSMPNKPMSITTAHSRDDVSYTEKSTSDDSENGNNSDSAATQKDILCLIFFIQFCCILSR